MLVRLPGNWDMFHNNVQTPLHVLQTLQYCLSVQGVKGRCLSAAKDSLQPTLCTQEDTMAVVWTEAPGTALLKVGGAAGGLWSAGTHARTYKSTIRHSGHCTGRLQLGSVVLCSSGPRPALSAAPLTGALEVYSLDLL